MTAEHQGVMFSLAGVSKSYAGLEVLAPLTINIENGERVALMGPSGSGKSTLMNILAGVTPPTTGRLLIEGHPSDELRPGTDLSRRVGIMPQSFDLVPTLPVVQNVLAGRLGEWGFVRSLVSLIFPRDLERARVAVERVGIPEKLYDRTSQLSGGQQQRVALARLLVQRPRAVLADEPVSSVDPARAEDLIAMLVRITQEEGQTLIASLHSVPLALRFFSRIIALRDGQLAFDLPADQVTDLDLNQLYALQEEKAVRAESR